MLQCFRVTELEKENIFGENLGVDNGKSKEANVEGECGVNLGSNDLPQQNCIVQDKEKSRGADMAVDNEQFGLRGANMAVDSGENKGDDMGEDEDDDGDYDYNYWHEYCRNDCVTDEDDDFEGSSPKRRGGGQSRSNRNWRSGPMSGRGQGSGKPVSGRGQRSSATGLALRTPKKKNTKEGVDVVLLTPPKPNNQHNRVIEDDDDFVESVRSGDTGESVDVVLVTPPKQHNKHICVIEDDDEADDPPITECT
ncbi:hypothetical protein Bca4012_076141 [Brassica carinata]